MWFLQFFTLIFALLTPALGAWPTATSSKTVTATIKVSGTYDGGLIRFIAGSQLGNGDQSENQLPVFELSDGAYLKNVILGSPAADGIHCLGSCTLQNVWWEDVGEDAATLKGTKASQTMTINTGGARNASDKVFQHDGPGTMIIKNFEVESFGKLYRSCGNCGTQYARSVVLQNITAKAPGKVLAGINPNYGDKAQFSQITIVGDTSRKIVVCEKYQGVTSGEPSPVGSGPDANCVYSSSDITYK